MLTPDQLESFHRNGFLIMRGVLRGRELELLQAAAARTVAEGIARQGQDHLYVSTEGGWDKRGDTYWRSENIWARDPAFRAATVNPTMLENIGQCIGQAFFPWNDSLVVKQAAIGSAVPWHQDPPYGDTGEDQRLTTHPIPNFTTDFYLDHSGPDNGCVWAIPGHHLVGHVDLSAGADACFSHPAAVPVEMEAGDVLFHCLSTPHGSRPNRAATTRRTFYVHYLCEEVFADCYGRYEWSKAKPGWGAGKQAQLAQMIADRQTLGLDDTLASPHVALGEGGFRSLCLPATTREAMTARIAAIPVQEVAAKKRLQIAAAAR